MPNNYYKNRPVFPIDFGEIFKVDNTTSNLSLVQLKEGYTLTDFTEEDQGAKSFYLSDTDMNLLGEYNPQYNLLDAVEILINNSYVRLELIRSTQKLTSVDEVWEYGNIIAINNYLATGGQQYATIILNCLTGLVTVQPIFKAATVDTVGVVSVGEGLYVTNDGTLSADTDVELTTDEVKNITVGIYNQVF